MTLTREVGNNGNIQSLGDYSVRIKRGDTDALGPLFVDLPVVNDVMVLPDSQKCESILGGFASVGTLTGPLLGLDPGATQIAGTVKPDADGNVLFATADAVTQAEIVYVTIEGSLVSRQLQVTINLATLPGGEKLRQILSVVSDEGGVTGTLAVALRGATPGAGFAAINAAGTRILFAAADAVTLATVSYLAMPGTGSAADGLAARLASDMNNL